MNLLLFEIGAIVLSALLSGIALLVERGVASLGPLYRSLVCRAALVSLWGCVPTFGVAALLLPPPAPFEETAVLPAGIARPLGERGAGTFVPSTLRVTTQTAPVKDAVLSAPTTNFTRPHVRPFFVDPPRPAQKEQIAAALYLAFAAVRLFWLALAYAGTVRLRRRAVAAPGEPDVFFSADVPSALTVGIRRPVILLPPHFWQEWEASLASAILAHEREHSARRDPFWNMGFHVMEALLWPLPFLGWLRRRHEQAGEEIADQTALATGTEPRRYADCLLRLVERQVPTLLTSGILSRPASVTQRVECLLRPAFVSPFRGARRFKRHCLFC